MRDKSEVPKVAIAAAFLFLFGVAPGFAQVAGLSAPGQPYVDCRDAAARHQRLASGLDVQRRAIDREQALLDALTEERKAGTAEARDQLKARAAEELKSQAEEALENLVEARQALERNPGNTLTADFLKWKKSVDAVQTRVEQLLALRDSFAAGYNYATEIQARSHDVLGHLREANKLFVDSGLAEAVGGKLAAAGGPAGVAAFEGSLFLMDQLVADLGNWDRRLEEQRAADNLNRMKWGLSEVEQKMDYLVQDCPAQFGKDTGTQSPPTASTSLTPPLPEPQAPAASASKKSGGKGGKAAVAVIGTGVAVGGALYAGKLAGDLATMSAGTTASSRNCIVSVMGHGCDCAGSVTGLTGWTGPTASAGEGCTSGTPCAANLSCNNGRCEGSNGRCPF